MRTKSWQNNRFIFDDKGKIAVVDSDGEVTFFDNYVVARNYFIESVIGRVFQASLDLAAASEGWDKRSGVRK